MMSGINSNGDPSDLRGNTWNCPGFNQKWRFNPKLMVNFHHREMMNRHQISCEVSILEPFQSSRDVFFFCGRHCLSKRKLSLAKKVRCDHWRISASYPAKTFAAFRCGELIGFLSIMEPRPEVHSGRHGHSFYSG